jgi:hypothetical protein
MKVLEEKGGVQISQDFSTSFPIVTFFTTFCRTVMKKPRPGIHVGRKSRLEEGEKMVLFFIGKVGQVKEFHDQRGIDFLT